MLNMKKISILISLTFLSVSIKAQSNFVDSAIIIFNNVRTICEQDNGKLWGHTLWKPVKIFNPETHQVVSNVDISSFNLKKKGNYFVGIEPQNINKDSLKIINKKITFIRYAYSKDITELSEVILHDSYHSVQREFNLAGICYQAIHLTNTSARIFLRLEWNYLWNAYNEKTKEKKKNLIDTAIFLRNYRRSLYSGSDTIENRFEILEGMAEFTGIYLATLKSDSLIKQKIEVFKKTVEKLQDYSRNYGYLTGLLYGSVLSQFSKLWTKDINKDSDLGLLLAKYSNSKPIVNLDLIRVQANINYKYIEKEEKNIEEIKKKEKTDIAARFKNSSKLTLSLKNANYSYNPSTFLYIDSLGTYCPYFTISADWGRLVVTQNGGIFSKDWKTLFISVSSITINDKVIIDSENWKLILSEKWSIQKESENYIIKNMVN